ncbi:MAG TPA: class I SAM-dependent methyltransferase [Gaiellaceae bacterium]|nr:class I SAM-dependent methyltransferase [Gaiellaceae bacterium]
MAEGLKQGHYLLGVEGLALLRAGARRSFDGVEARTEEIREILSRLDEPPYSERRDLPEADVDAGYAQWAEDYDEPGNDTIAAEEPVVRELLDELPAGSVLDAACGTGRHVAYLCGRGRPVIGVDGSQAMLDRAAAKLSDADLRLGELTALPLTDGEVAGAVCALALSHLSELGPAIMELGRVLKPGGRLIVSNPHPFATAILGWRAVFVDADGRRSMIPEYPHLHGDYIAAFAAAGLMVRRCIEPRLSAEQAKARAKKHRVEAFEDALTDVPAVIVWEAERR